MSPPQAWVRTKSKTKTRRVKAVPKTEEPTTVPMVVRDQEMDPGVLDRTVEVAKAFLAEYSSDIMGLAEGTDESFRPDRIVAEVWGLTEDEIPTAQVRYLGEDDPHSYDIEDLVEPPDAEVIENIIRHGVEDPSQRPSAGEVAAFFLDLDENGLLDDWSLELAAPGTDAEVASTRAERPVSPFEHIQRVNEIVARSRELVSDSTTFALEHPPAPPLEPPPERRVPTQELEDWQLLEEWEFIDVEVRSPSPAAGRGGSPWPSRIAGAGLALIAGWAYATAVAWPAVAALLVGALALLLLGGRSG